MSLRLHAAPSMGWYEFCCAYLDMKWAALTEAP